MVVSLSKASLTVKETGDVSGSQHFPGSANWPKEKVLDHSFLVVCCTSFFLVLSQFMLCVCEPTTWDIHAPSTCPWTTQCVCVCLDSCPPSLPYVYALFLFLFYCCKLVTIYIFIYMELEVIVGRVRPRLTTLLYWLIPLLVALHSGRLQCNE